MRTITSRAALGIAVAAGLSSCAILPPFNHHLQLRPISLQQPPTGSREDGYYASAKTAIARRDYARALYLLQAARALKPEDARILNAFGVVYDKLGRFDLSTPYYAQAEAADPGSMIVASNMAWSAALRARAAAPADANPVEQSRLALSTPEPAGPPQVIAPDRPTVLRLGFAAQPAAGEPLGGVLVANASGRSEAADAVALGLRRLGWTPRVDPAPTAARVTSTITYPAAKADVAKALAATLGQRPHLVDCGVECERIRLVLGQDSTSWSIARNEVWERRQ